MTITPRVLITCINLATNSVRRIVMYRKSPMRGASSAKQSVAWLDAMVLREIEDTGGVLGRRVLTDVYQDVRVNICNVVRQIQAPQCSSKPLQAA